MPQHYHDIFVYESAGLSVAFVVAALTSDYYCRNCGRLNLRCCVACGGIGGFVFGTKILQSIRKERSNDKNYSLVLVDFVANDVDPKR